MNKRLIKLLAAINAGINSMEMVPILLFVGYYIIINMQTILYDSFPEIIENIVVTIVFMIWPCIGGLVGIKSAYKLAGQKGYASTLISGNVCILFFEILAMMVARVISIFDWDIQLTINKLVVIKLILVCIMVMNTIIIYLSARKIDSDKLENNEINEANNN